MTDALQKIPAVKRDPADTLKHFPSEIDFITTSLSLGHTYLQHFKVFWWEKLQYKYNMFRYVDRWLKQ